MAGAVPFCHRSSSARSGDSTRWTSRALSTIVGESGKQEYRTAAPSSNVKLRRSRSRGMGLKSKEKYPQTGRGLRPPTAESEPADAEHTHDPSHAGVTPSSDSSNQEKPLVYRFNQTYSHKNVCDTLGPWRASPSVRGWLLPLRNESNFKTCAILKWSRG